MNRWVIVAIALLLSGCSVKTLYSWLDWIIPWKVEEYVTLTKVQKQLLDDSTRRQLDWHRQQELPRYLAQLETVQRSVGQELSPEQVMLQFETATSHSKRLLQQILPDIVALALTLSEPQVNEIKSNLLAELEKDKNKFAKLSPNKRIDGASKKISKKIRNWIGRLSEEQVAIIAKYAKARQSTAQPWFTYRQDWINQLISVLAQRDQGKAFLTEQLSMLLITPEQLKGQEYLAEINNNRQHLIQGLLDIHRLMTPWQHRTLQRKLTGLHEDLNAIMD